MIEMFLELSGVVWWMWKSRSTAASLAGLWRTWQRKWWRSGFITFVLWNEPERDSAEHAALSHTYPWLPHLFSYWLTAGAELFLDALYFMFFPTLMGEAHQQHCLLWVTVAIRAVFSTVVIDADHQLCAHTHTHTQAYTVMLYIIDSHEEFSNSCTKTPIDGLCHWSSLGNVTWEQEADSSDHQWKDCSALFTCKSHF